MAQSRTRKRLKAWFNALAGWFTVTALNLLRRTDRSRMADRLGWLMRRVGPWLPENRIGRENLVAAFPEKSSQDIDTILAGAWDNLGRIAAEFAHIDRYTIYDPTSDKSPEAYDLFYDEVALQRFINIRDAGKPALFFAAHLANWEIPALASHTFGIPASILYRRPNIGAASDAIVALRERCMGTLVPTGLDAPVRLVRALQRGDHVAMLVDQYYVRGVDVTFFGRTTKANPLIAQLARLTDCKIYGVHAVRLPDGKRFQGFLSEEVEAVRDADGKVDIQGTMQAVTSVVEGWVRDHPEQWLWLHRRWR